MIRRLAVGLALSLIVAACGDDDVGPIFTTDASSNTTTQDIEAYPEVLVEEYVGGCITEADDGFCRCTIDEFQQRLTIGEFLELSANELDSSPVFQEVLQICLLQGIGHIWSTNLSASGNR